MKNKFIVCVPFTGLGMYNGFRGNRWLRNRISIFEHFVVPSLHAQTSTNFILWIAWRREERSNQQVIELKKRLDKWFPNVVFTYSGVPFWDDKYPDEEARDRLLNTLMKALPDLMDVVGECDQVYWLLQPSDDCYRNDTINRIETAFQDPKVQAVGYERGYISNYNTREVLEYNPKTNPPFFAIKFPRNIFFDPGKHAQYTGPYKSHEYVGDKLNLIHLSGRGFLVGTHGENISTHFNHPYGGATVDESILADFGLSEVEPIKLKISVRKWILRKLPYRWQRKLRYIIGERFVNRFYEFLRN